MIKLTKSQKATRTSLSTFIAEGHPVAVSVETLREAAIARAAEFSQKKIDSVKKQLEEGNWDREVVAPYPDILRNSREDDYRRKHAFYNLVRRLTESTNTSGYRSFRDKNDFCVMSDKGCEKFIQDNKEMAAIQYDAFVIKLIGKVGPVVKAECASHAGVWGRSTLTVTQKDGKVQNWLTQQIINYSVLGTAYNQWPTRKVK
jgi:hypothetical protein